METDEEQERQVVKSVRKEYGGMKALVQQILKQSVKARNNDQWLIVRVLENLGENIKAERSAMGFDIVWRFNTESIGKLPNFETIRRVRAEIQNKDGEFLPTDIKVMIRRRIKEETVRAYYAGQTVLDEYEETITVKRVEPDTGPAHYVPTHSGYCDNCGTPMPMTRVQKLCEFCIVAGRIRR